MRIRIQEGQQKRLLRWGWWASDRWTGGATIGFLLVLLRVLFPGIWASWLGHVILSLLAIFALGFFTLVAIRAYHRKDCGEPNSDAAAEDNFSGTK